MRKHETARDPIEFAVAADAARNYYVGIRRADYDRQHTGNSHYATSGGDVWLSAKRSKDSMIVYFLNVRSLPIYLERRQPPLRPATEAW